MDVSGRQRIQLNLTRLADDLTPSEVTPALVQSRILSFDDAERIAKQVGWVCSHAANVVCLFVYC